MENIKSLLDTDLYTFSQQQFILHNHPATWAQYEFKWRNWNEMHLKIPIKDFAGRLRDKLDEFCKLKFTDDELDFLGQLSYLSKDYIEYLRLYQPHRRCISVRVADDMLGITISGPWLTTIIFEVPVLAMISQLYTENNSSNKASWLVKARERLKVKLSLLETSLTKDNTFKFADFGTRRRADALWHDEVIDTIIKTCPKNFAGTSNVLLAKKYGIKAIGTMSHQLLMAFQQLGPRLMDSQKVALQEWANEYRGELGIALSDCLGFKAFLKDFDRYFALLFDGCRHDSGDPNWWVESLIEHYKKLRIDPRSKYAVFSDGLNFETAIDLYKRYHTQINTSFGIGTNLTNDVGFIAPQIVIKLTKINNRPVAKISDSLGKGMCEDPEFEQYLIKVINEKVK